MKRIICILFFIILNACSVFKSEKDSLIDFIREIIKNSNNVIAYIDNSKYADPKRTGYGIINLELNAISLFNKEGYNIKYVDNGLLENKFPIYFIYIEKNKSVVEFCFINYSGKWILKSILKKDRGSTPDYEIDDGGGILN